MLRSIRTAAAASATAVALLAASNAAWAGQQDFTIVNDSYEDIFYVYVSPSSSDSWGPDVLAENILPAGHTFDVYMNGFGAECLFDIQVANAYGETLEFWGVDLCTVAEVVVY